MPDYTNTTNGTVTSLCYGPYTPSILLPIYTGTSNQTGMATYVCGGSADTALWIWGNNIVRTQPATNVSPASWISSPYWTQSNLPLIRDGRLFTPPKPPPRQTPRIIRNGRRALRRSIDLFARFHGQEKIAAFLRGEAVTFSGAIYEDRVKKTRLALEQTMNPAGPHIPYQLHALDKRTGAMLASGCVVFQALPVIDQILALSFHIQDPTDELRLIQTANWSPRLRLPQNEVERLVA